MWSRAPLDIAKRYQATTIAHYQRLQRGHGEAMSTIIESYQNVML
jgi:tRNA (adenine22-N1)-methyltransferase